ncbi:MAG: hypothetical protein KF747_03450 [Nitrospira sp.]|nr:hypothetical protein [Nitrospira sp.]
MKLFMLGVLAGSFLTGSFGLAGTFYDNKGQPSGSIQQFDYFRQRQQSLDLNAIRRNQEEQMRQQRLNPC